MNSRFDVDADAAYHNAPGAARRAERQAGTARRSYPV
jgi:hypothetical protein